MRVARTRRGPRIDVAAVSTALVVVMFGLPLLFLAWETLTRARAAGELIFSSATAGPLARSLLVATAATATAAIVGISIAWLVTQTDLPGRRLWAVLVPLPLVIPSFVGATALRFAFGPGGILPFIPRLDGFIGAWLALTLFTFPYVYLPVAARLRTLPASLEDAGRLLGSSSARILRTITLPQIAPAAYAGMLLVFLYSLSDFGAVSIMRYDTLTRAIFSARLAAPTTALSLGFVLAVVALIIAGAQRPSRAGRLAKGVPRSAVRRRRVSRWVVVVPGTVVALGLLAPLTAFTVWWMRGTIVGGGGASAFAETLTSLARPAINSTVAGVVAAITAVAILLPVAFVANRPASRLGRAATLGTAATFALPGVVVAFAIVFWIVRAPEAIFALYQSFPLLIAAYVVHFGAQALQPMSGAVRSLPTSVSEAAGTLGAGPRRRFWTINFPLLTPELTAAGGLVLLSVLKELPATLLLAPIGFTTLATKIWSAAEEGFLADAGASSLVLIALSGLLTWLLVLRGESD